MRLSEYASTRKTRGSHKMPRSVQQSIPIDRIYADGVWQSENVFSLMWQISDINYAMQSDAAKQNILTQLGTLYAGIPADCWMQVCIVSQRMDEKAFAHDVLYHRENDGYDALRAERNRLIKASARENGNVVQHKYIIISTNKTGVKDARERFVQVQGHLLSAFSALECAVTPLDNRARLEVLHAECRENQGVSHWAQLPHPQGKRNSLFAERNTRRLQHCQCDNRQCGVKGIYPLSYRCHLYR